MTAIPDPTGFSKANTALKAPSLIAELRLHLADDALPLWEKTEEEMGRIGLPPPFWAFAWAGGQALARHILDDGDWIAGKRVLDLASGSGLVALAALRRGAAQVTATEIDGFAIAAIALNAAANGLADRLTVEEADITDRPPPRPGAALAHDVILAGDVCYEEPMAGRIVTWLRGHAAAGATVLLGDPGRTYLPKSGLEWVAEYRVPVPLELEDNDVRRTIVWRVLGHEAPSAVPA